jgi:hypothetical protein
MPARALAAAAAAAALLTPPAAANADSVGEVVATQAAGFVGVQQGPLGGERGLVARLGASGALEQRGLEPSTTPQSLPDLARFPADSLVVAWRGGRVVRPAQAPLPPIPEGVFSGRFDAREGAGAGPVTGGLRASERPERVQVAARPDGGHVLLWVSPAGTGLRAQAVAPDGTVGAVRALPVASAGPPSIATSRRHVWVAASSEDGGVRILRLTRAAGRADEFAIDPEGGEGPYRLLDLAGDGYGGAIALHVHEERGRSVLAITHVANDVGYGLELVRARRGHDFAAEAAAVRGRALVAYTDGRGASRALLGAPRRDLLGPTSAPVRLGRGERVEDLVARGGDVRVLVRGRRGMALRRLAVRDGRVRAAGRALDLSPSSRGQRDGSLDVDGNGRAYAAWEQVVSDTCVQAVVATARGRRARSVAIEDC